MCWCWSACSRAVFSCLIAMAEIPRDHSSGEEADPMSGSGEDCSKLHAGGQSRQRRRHHHVRSGDHSESELDTERLARTKRHIRVLFHQTSADAAAKIVASQKMYRGSDGIAGGGIYFAESPDLTAHKCKLWGVILEATVLLGSQKIISSTGDMTITFRSLQRKGYDSVLVQRPGGADHVVYNFDQVKDIKVYRP